MAHGKSFRHSLISSSLAAFFLMGVTAPVLASDSDFSTQYQAYQTAIETGDASAIEAAAAKAFHAGVTQYGEQSVNTAALAANWAGAILELPVEYGSESQAANKQQAYQLYKQALDIHEKISGNKAIELIDPLLGMADSAKTDYDAKGYFERAISIAQQQDKPLLVADVKTLAFKALSKTPLYTKAVKQYAFDAYDIYTKALPENALARVKATYTLGAVQYAHKQYDEAEPLLVEVIKQFDALDYTHPYALTAHAYLVEIYEQLGDRDKSTQHCVAIGSMQPWKDSQEQTPIFRVPPDYPMYYVKRGKSGWVEVEFTVDESGFVTEPIVLQSEGGSLFEKETIKTLEKWRYAPKFESGKPVAAKSKVRLDYTIAP